MNRPAISSRLLHPPPLTRTGMALALIIAMLADGLQLLLGPFGWVFGDQIIDVTTMVLAMWLLGFHWLLLPSFVLELVPLADEFPTWTACVVAVIALRKRQQRKSPPSLPNEPVIDV